MEIQPEYVWRKAKHVAFADKVIQTKNKDPWAAIELMLDYWKKTNPKEYESFVVDVMEARKTRANAYGSSRDKNSSLRYTLDIPAQVWQMIVSVFGDKELIDPYSKNFFREFARRFPSFKVAERS